MKTTREKTTIKVEFENRLYKITVDFLKETFKIDLTEKVDSGFSYSVLELRQYANELVQIAKLVKDELNQVKGYEFNEDVETNKTH